MAQIVEHLMPQRRKRKSQLRVDDTFRPSNYCVDDTLHFFELGRKVRLAARLPAYGGQANMNKQ
jgi:hypothetical protein